MVTTLLNQVLIKNTKSTRCISQLIKVDELNNYMHALLNYTNFSTLEYL